jgi:hypothetical protein
MFVLPIDLNNIYNALTVPGNYIFPLYIWDIKSFIYIKYFSSD